MEIKPESTTLEKIFNGLSTRYHVPEYQRDYSWTVNQVEELWTDIITAYRTGHEYFMGAVVLNSRDSQEDEYDIVDGQQRLATFSILFAAIATIGERFPLNDKIFPSIQRSQESGKIAKKIYEKSVARLREPSEPDNYFINMNKKDHQKFDSIVRDTCTVLIEDCDLRIQGPDSRVVKTRKKFFSLIWNEFSSTPDPLGSLHSFLVFIITKLRFISIKVKDDYDAFLLFEALNSKGLDLSVSDLVKNKLLMRVKGNAAHSSQILESWESIEDCMEESRASSVDYLRVYWESIMGRPVSKKELYKDVKTYIQAQSPDATVIFVGDLRDKASTFVSLTRKDFTFPQTLPSSAHSESVRICIEMNTLKYTLHYPLVLYAAVMQPNLLEEVCKLAHSFLFRWITVGENSVGGAKKILDSALKALRSSEPEKNLRAAFFEASSKICDDEFKNAFSNMRVYDNSVAKYILSKLHMYHVQNQTYPNYPEVHLEHVLPQDSSRWEETFKAPLPTSIRDWIYNIGNMTLLQKKLNQSISNSPFSEKAPSYMNSPFPMTNSIFSKHVMGLDWDVKIIKTRADEFAKAATEVWPFEPLTRD